jgi:hypothetical protein
MRRSPIGFAVLGKHIDKAFAAAEVNPVAFRVREEIIDIFAGRNGFSFKIKCCVDRLRPPVQNGLGADIPKPTRLTQTV